MSIYIKTDPAAESQESILLKRLLREQALKSKDNLSNEDLQKIIANAVSQAVSGVADAVTSKMSSAIEEKIKNNTQVVYNNTVQNTRNYEANASFDDFDTSKTMEKLANSMITTSKGSESSLENIGDVHETKKNEKDMKDAIDFLSNIDD